MGGFVHVPAGLFYMGSPKSEAERGGDESPLHEVQVSDFWMAQHEVTQAEWTAVMGSNPSNFKSTQLPVEQVTWYDVLVYANKRSIMEGRKPCYSLAGKTDPSAWGSVSAAWNGIKCDFTANGYRLPSEAEWEYACRAGTTTATAFGKSLSSKQANFDGTFPYNGAAKGLSVGKTRAVGSYAPNAWGLFDMHGNVHEWCWDWYGNYGAADSKNPSGASSGENRVFRGGGWRLDGSELRSAYRDSGKPGFSSRYLGFRVVRR
jgi:formylglycine-generating enzyme required for sulfatase activity